MEKTNDAVTNAGSHGKTKGRCPVQLAVDTETTGEACTRMYTSHRGRTSRENERNMSPDEVSVKIHSGDRIHTSRLFVHLWVLFFNRRKLM